MRTEYSIFAPLVGCIYIVLGLVIIVGVLSTLGDALLTGDSGNEIVNYFIIIFYALYTGDY